MSVTILCWHSLHAQPPDSVVYFTWYDMLLHQGYDRLSSSSLGSQYFKVQYGPDKKLVAHLMIGEKSIVTYAQDKKGYISQRDFSDHRLNYRDFDLDLHDSFTSMHFKKPYRGGKKSWRCSEWSRISRDQVITISIQDETPNHAIRYIKPDSSRLNFAMPDTSHLYFLLTVKDYQYKGNDIYWEQKKWLVDRRFPLQPLRWLTQKTVFHYRTPISDPNQILGFWGLLNGENIGEIVEEYVLETPYPGMKIK
jgi:hypothetical protein